jgi:hypothetical protein
LCGKGSTGGRAVSERHIDGISPRGFLARAAAGGAGNALAAVVVLGALLCGCHSARHPAARPASTTTAVLPPPTTSVAAAVRIRPLPVRPVRGSKMTTPEKCPATNPSAPVAPTAVLNTCDLARSTLYTLGPEAMQLALIRVDPPKPLTADYFEVHLTMDAASAAGWASYTTEHLHAHIAFVRDELVLEAPTIQEPVGSGQIALTTQTAPAADELARLAGQPE